MSFDMGPMGNLSNVQKSAKTMDGGGGNTGYFSRQGGEQDEKNLVEFAKDYPNDTFEKVTLEDIEQKDDGGFLSKIKSFIKKLLLKLKALFKK